ncbi:MAG: NAD(P)-dependent oxidoreductase [Ignavibacteriales bacterium]|nr:NAD(P)-dependent oxidoreductase [Ignavibacteriales bacterium]
MADLVEAGAAAGVRRVVHCSTVGVHGDVEHPPAGEDAPLRPGDEYQRSKLEGERLGREAAARTGHGPGDRQAERHLRARRPPAAQAVPRRRAAPVRHARVGEIFYHLTYVEDLAEGFRLCGEVPAAAGRTYILAGGEVTTLNELVRRIAAAAGVRPPSLPLAGVARAGSPARRARRCACRSASSRRCTAGGVDFFTKSRAFDIARARARAGVRPAGRPATRASAARWRWYRRTGVAVMADIPEGAGPAVRRGHARRSTSTPRLVVGRPGLVARSSGTN